MALKFTDCPPPGPQNLYRLKQQIQMCYHPKSVTQGIMPHNLVFTTLPPLFPHPHWLSPYPYSYATDDFYIQVLALKFTDCPPPGPQNLYRLKQQIQMCYHPKNVTQVSQLKKKKQINKEAEYPVAYGRWMKPKCLVYAKFDFLCIDATVFSTKHPDRAEELEFMVDSGSDVVTLRKDIVEKLDLKELGHVRSKGVHVSMHKTLYEAKLKLGSVELKIEVISEEYNSLGNRVFRCFRHYISGSRHIWLKGDYVDPSMQCEPSGNYSRKDRESDEENNQISVMKPTDSKLNGCPLDEVVSNTEEAKSKADQTEDDEAQRLDHIASQDIDNQTKQNYTEGDELAEYSESVQEKYKTPKRSRKLRPLCASKLKRDRKSRKRKRNLFSNEEPSRKKACGKLTYDTVAS
ncbi:uncharacterized protein LOC115221258 [Octopus sinensis]|uniref:Uncharacterized protein LOC115221258 n=1 Tax=Octopus sinensis TaxID=2607531 RepID=A0A6P7TAV3_9MOLL|nr:uncharacterized protein LOC115221258 [Octopus sinensis]